MIQPTSRIWTVSACFLLAECAGYRGGWESVPYVGEQPPTLPEYRTPFEARKRSELKLPGVTLSVAIHNQTRTYDTQVYLFVLPLSVDSRTVQTQPGEPGRTRVSLSVSNTNGDLVFRPQAAKLFVAGKAVPALAAFEFGMWDAAGNRVTSGGTWAHRVIDEEQSLPEVGRTYHLSIDFPVPVPSPAESGIALDLSDALRAPGKPTIPIIRFNPTRWKQGYT